MTTSPKTQFSSTIDKMYAAMTKVEEGTLNPQLAVVMTTMASTMFRGAVAHSQHQRYQQKIPKVKFFDEALKGRK